MSVGERIRELRTARNLTQPQLAEAIGIEQSYLSKLENDKSAPSTDIFRSILKALGVDVADFLRGLDAQTVQRQLKQIPEVSDHVLANARRRFERSRRWWYGSALACVIGLSLGGAGAFGLLFPNTQYNYHSPGVVRPGEPSDILLNYESLLLAKMLAGEISDNQRMKSVAGYKLRIQEHSLLLPDYRGDAFIIPAEGGSRSYYYKGAATHERPVNRYLMLTGMVLTLGGIFGYFFEHRLRDIPAETR